MLFLGWAKEVLRGSYLVTMEWYGAKNKSKPLAFVGKGVCFDTGGIHSNLQSLWRT